MARRPSKKNSLVSDRDGTVSSETRLAMSDTSEPQSPDADQTADASQKAPSALSASGDIITLITVLYRDRRFAMEQRKRSDLAIGAYLRSALGWRKDSPEAERKAIGIKAKAIAKAPEGTKWEQMVLAQAESRKPFEAIEDTALKEMTGIAKALPIWKSFGEDVRGFGAASLAVILAEAGSLDNYSTIPKLWKRMGLAVMGDVRQGGLTKGAGADAWIAHGYNPTRRSAMWNIGDTMLKAQVRKVKDEAGEDTGERRALGVYGAAYLERKAKKLALNPEMRPIHAHRDAQRYMEKRLLKHLWQAWRRAKAGMVETPIIEMPDAPIQIAA